MKELLITSLLGVAVLGMDILNLRKLVLPLVALALLAVIGCVVLDWGLNENPFANNMLIFDNFALGFTGVFCLITLLWFFLSRSYFSSGSRSSDLYALVLFALAGGVVLVSYSNMVMLFLGIEILSIPMYILAASKRGDVKGNEAGFKYFFLGALASATLLFGIALIYGATGSFDLVEISQSIGSGDYSVAWLMSGFLLVIAGFAFKISVAPFHLWAPDVYQGSPTAITALMATLVKGAAFGAMYRLFAVAFPAVSIEVATTLAWLAGITLVLANLIGSVQSSVKRLLAYSSISHAGFMLATIMTCSQSGSAGNLLFYVLTYSIASLASFMVLYYVSSFQEGRDDFDAFKGLVKRNPVLAGTMTLALLSMAGIPPLSGFMAKYLVIGSTLSAGYTWLVIIMILTSVVAVYYYLKLISTMFSPLENAGRIVTGGLEKWLLIVMTILMIGLMFFAGYFSTLI